MTNIIDSKSIIMPTNEHKNNTNSSQLLEKCKKDIEYYIDRLEKTNRISLKKKMKQVIFIQLKKNEHIQIYNNKIVFNLQLWVNLSTTEIFKNNSHAANIFTQDLIAKKLIASSSIPYPKNQKFLDINPLPNSFLNIDLKVYDKIHDIRDNIINKLYKCDSKIEQEKLLYIYLRLFVLNKIPLDYYQHFTRKNIFEIGNNIIFIVTHKEYKNFIPIKTLIFSGLASKVFKKIFFTHSLNILDYNDHIFTKEVNIENNYYEKILKQFILSCNIGIKTFKHMIQFEYQLHNSPLLLTLSQYTKHPKCSLLELDCKFPNIIDKRLLDIDRSNMNIYRNSDIDHHKDDYETNIDDYLGTDIEIYTAFKKIAKVNTKRFLTYLNNCYTFIERNKYKVEAFTPIFNHVQYLVAMSDKRVSKKTISIKTLQGYLQVLFQYCFTHIVFNNNTNNAIINIHDKLDNDMSLTYQTKKSYRRIISRYLNKEYDLKINNINSIIYQNRSIVFEKELDKLISTLKYKDREYKYELLKIRRIVFVILAYYTGLRKNELISRTIKDIYYINNRTFVIDVNLIGLNKVNKYLKSGYISFKNKNAIRRVEFTINNTKHFNILKKYLNLIENLKIEFLFPKMNKSKTVSKKQIIEFRLIDEINILLQNITKRYTVIHSFRHTYATNELYRIINSKNKKLEDIFDLAIKMGHSEPSVTLDNYAHLELFRFT